MSKMLDIWFRWTYCILKGAKKEKVICIFLMVLLFVLNIVGLVIQYA